MQTNSRRMCLGRQVAFSFHLLRSLWSLSLVKWVKFFIFTNWCSQVGDTALASLTITSFIPCALGLFKHLRSRWHLDRFGFLRRSKLDIFILYVFELAFLLQGSILLWSHLLWLLSFKARWCITSVHALLMVFWALMQRNLTGLYRWPDCFCITIVIALRLCNRMAKHLDIFNEFPIGQLHLECDFS